MKIFKRSFFSWVFMVTAGFMCSYGILTAEETAQGYHIIQKISLPGDGGYDFLSVDNDARRIYLSHNNSIQLVDADGLTLIGTVEKVAHPHGIVFIPELGKGFASSGDPGSVVVFDLKTFQHVAEIPTAADCDVILYDKPSGKVLTFNGDSHTACVIDPEANKLDKMVTLEGGPEVAVSDGKGHLYDNLETKSLVLKMDPETLKVLKSWPLAPGESPSGLSMDLKNNRLFSGCHNHLLVVMNAKNGKVIQTLPIGDHVDGTAFDPDTGNIFSSNGDGTLTVIHEDSPNKYRVVENVRTQPGAKTLALDSKTGRIFLTVAKREAPPTPTKEDPKPRGKIVSGSFQLLVVGK